MREFRMPKLALGEDDRMTVLRWLVAEGETISEGQLVLEVETDKATMEVDAPFDGVVARIVRSEDDQVEPGELVAWVAGLDEAYERDALGDEPEVERKPSDDGAPPAPVVDSQEPLAQTAGRLLAISDPELPGDVRGFPLTDADSPAPAPAPAPTVAARAPEPAVEGTGAYESIALNRHRLAVGQAMERSNQIPQFAVFRELDVGAAREALESVRRTDPRATLTDLILFAIAKAVVQTPALNSWFAGDQVLRFQDVNIALAVDGPNGVISPVVRSVQRLGLSALIHERARLVTAARAGRLGSRDLQGGTFTLSNIGPMDADGLLPMLTPPQVAILATGRIRKIAGREAVAATLVGDHRVIDGADGARFLAALNDELRALAVIPAGEGRTAQREEESRPG
jgi:pyruvate/2-oxoglutarate dehydrogenase complex dihydrolipoamide acyltransferase (E2) component